jgi:CRP/FNR family cyclic AMP-dependent transcriptional regulator
MGMGVTPGAAGDVVIPSIFTGSGTCVCYHDIAHKFEGMGTLHSLPGRSEIFRQGTPVDMVYLIERGLIKLSHYSPGGRETLVGLRRPYWLLGATPAIQDKLRSVTATTLSPCALRFITRQQFNDLSEDLAFSRFLTCVLSLEISGNVKRMIALSSLSGEERVMQLVAEIITAQIPCEVNDKISLAFPLKQNQIAQILGMSPEHLSRLMGRLERRGLFSHSRGTITIARPLDFLRILAQP